MGGLEIILSALCLNVTTCDNSTIDRPAINTFLELSDGLAAEAKERQLAKLREELNGEKLTIVSLEDYPLSYVVQTNKSREPFGVSFQLLDFLTEKFNFTYDLIFPDNNIFGSSTDMKGSLIEVLNNSKADMAAAFIPILADARNFIEYSSTTLDEGEWIMIMLRPAESATGAGLLAPFDRDVWILIFISVLAVGPIIYGLIIVRQKLTRDKTQQIYSMPHCMWFVYGGLMKQGSTLSPLADSTRLLFATWWIFITILTSFYTANLTAFLTLSKFTLPINSVDDIIKKDKNFVSQRGSLVEYAIKNSNESLTQLYKMVQNNRAIFTDNYNGSESLINWVEQKNYVFIRDRPAMNHLIYSDYLYRKEISRTDEKIHCPFAISSTPFIKRRRSFAYPKNSKWSKLFDPELLHIVESGIIKYMLTEKLPDATICPQDLASTERQLRNGDLLMTYQIMIAGFCTACVIFITELIFKLLNNRFRFKNGELSTPISDYFKTKGQPGGLKNNITPPPPYAELFNKDRRKVWPTQNTINTHGAVQKFINGRLYMVLKGDDGASRLIPIRQPSAALFQYSYAN